MSELAGYPLVLTRLSQSLCVVIGAGAVAQRKIEGLLVAGGRVRVVAPVASERIQGWAAQGLIEWHGRPYADGDLEGALLAFAATGQAEVDAAVAQEARERGVLLNSAGDPQGADFHTVAAVRRGPLLVGISTGGAGPAVAALLRRRIESLLGPELDELLAIVAALRAGPARGLDLERRAEVLRMLASEEVLGWLQAGQRDRVDELIEGLLR